MAPSSCLPSGNPLSRSIVCPAWAAASSYVGQRDEGKNRPIRRGGNMFQKHDDDMNPVMRFTDKFLPVLGFIKFQHFPFFRQNVVRKLTAAGFVSGRFRLGTFSGGILIAHSFRLRDGPQKTSRLCRAS